MVALTRRLLLSTAAILVLGSTINAQPIKRKVGIVYATKSKLPMMICLRDNEKDLTRSIAGFGQSFLIVNDNELRYVPGEAFRPELVRAKIALKHGIDPKTIPSGRCVLCDPVSGIVEDGAIIADPELFKHPTHTVIASDEALAGHKYDYVTKIFLAAYAIVDAKSGLVLDVKWLPLGTKLKSTDGVFVQAVGADVSIGHTLPACDLPINVASLGTTRF